MKKSLVLAALLSFGLGLIAQTNIQLRSIVPYDIPPYKLVLNDIWGYEDGSGNEYALVGTRTGVSIVDITDPDNAQELFFIPGDTSVWRDIKTFSDRAYVTNEKGGGLMIINLSNLPTAYSVVNWQTATLFDYETGHNIWIDENGVAYIFGHNEAPGGALMLDLNGNPDNPTTLGNYDDRYVHDGIVRGDTMWTSEIRAGEFSVVDVSDKQNPVVLATRQTPNVFTHNCWISDDGDYLFTTDERKNSKVAAYDVSDLNNIKLLDTYQSSPGDSVIPHNTHYYNGWLVTSYYRDGVTIVDAHKPDNLIEVGNYDTSPFSSKQGFEGCWGAFPFLTSGNLLATDRTEGLFVLTPTYKRATYVEGTVTDINTMAPVNNAVLEVMTTENTGLSSLTGEYKTGAANPGLYDIRITHPNCITRIIGNVQLDSAAVTILDVELECASATSIDHISSLQMELQVSPNPFHSSATISFSGADDDALLELYDMNGQLLKQYHFNTPDAVVELNQNLEAGIYIARLSSGAQVLSKRFIKVD